MDPKNNKVYCRATQDKKLGAVEEFSIDYDYLVIAMGARSNTFNTPGVQEHAYFLKVYIFVFDYMKKKFPLTRCCTKLN